MSSYVLTAQLNSALKQKLLCNNKLSQQMSFLPHNYAGLEGYNLMQEHVMITVLLHYCINLICSVTWLLHNALKTYDNG